jgi:hypothetical protein
MIDPFVTKISGSRKYWTQQKWNKFGNDWGWSGDSLIINQQAADWFKSTFTISALGFTTYKWSIRNT